MRTQLQANKSKATSERKGTIYITQQATS